MSQLEVCAGVRDLIDSVVEQVVGCAVWSARQSGSPLGVRGVQYDRRRSRAGG